MKLHSEAKLDAHLNTTVRGRNICDCCSGGGAPDNSGQNAAALMNAEIAKEMWGEYQSTYLPMERQFASEAFNYDTEGQRQKQAGLASADVTSAFAGQREQTGRQMASMGIDPSSNAWAHQAGKLDLAEAAAKAGAQNAARTNVENMGYARKQDAISLGKGMPGTAATSMANSGTMYGNIANSQLQAQQNQQSAIGNTIGGAAAAYGMWRKDGGIVANIVAKHGIKREQHMAGGGLAGNPKMQQVMVQPQVMPMQSAPTPNPVMQGIQAYRGVKNAEKLGKGIADMMMPAETGMAAMEGSTAVMTPEALAAANEITGTAAGTAGTTAAGTTAAGTAAAAGAAGTAGTAAAAGGAAASAAPLAAMGPVGWAALGGLALSQMFKKDGGSVERQDLSGGGRITGKGTETSDSIPAKTKNGSYILNAETAKMLGKGLPKDKVPLHVSKNEIAVPPELVRVIGKEKLDKLNAAGLARRYGVKGVKA